MPLRCKLGRVRAAGPDSPVLGLKVFCSEPSCVYKRGRRPPPSQRLPVCLEGQGEKIGLVF